MLVGHQDQILAYPPLYGLRDGDRFQLAAELANAVGWLDHVFTFDAAATEAQVSTALLDDGVLHTATTGERVPAVGLDLVPHQ